MFFFYNRIREEQLFTLPVVDDNEIVRSTSYGEEGKPGLICLVRYIQGCSGLPTYFAISSYPVTLDDGSRQNGVGWPPKTCETRLPVFVRVKSSDKWRKTVWHA